MSFIVEIEFISQKRYISNLILAYAKERNVNLKLMQSKQKIYLVFNKEQENLDKFLIGLEQILPASIFLGKSKHYFSDNLPNIKEIEKINLPFNISLCPRCQKEMFDINSNRYYYPFTACNSCGSSHIFLQNYPYNRQNSSFKYIQPCKKCLQEQTHNPYRKDFALISCLECSVNLRMVDKKSERFANDKESFKKLFEVAATAIAKNKTLLVKTLNGYRKFFKPAPNSDLKDAILLLTNANSLNKYLTLVPQEFNALLSIERPILRVTTKSQTLKNLFGSSTLAKFADDAITMLLAKELLNLNINYIAYVEANENEKADFLIDFDLPVTFQKDFKLFINQDTKFIISGDRASYPIAVESKKNIVTIANNLAAVLFDNVHIIDRLEKFNAVETKEVRVLQNQDYNLNIKRVREFKAKDAALLSVLSEHNLLNEPAIGVHFDNNLYYSFYNGAKVIDVINPVKFDITNLWEKISNLREGSDRLVNNFKNKFPKIYEELNSATNMDIFEAVATILELKDKNLEAISAKALEFYGKGGIAIDMKLKDNKFDNYAMIASILSYKVAGVDSAMLSYSLYESFGEYIGDIITQLVNSLNTRKIALSGQTFANQALYSALNKRIGIYKPLFNKSLPIDNYNTVYGALFL